MAKKIAITTESAADLSKEYQKKFDIRVIPMTVLIGDEEFKDGVDITPTELFEKSELYSSVPKTAGISPHEYKLVFETLTEKGFDVVHVALGGKISSCFQNALFASNGFENVFVVDSQNLSAGTALLAIEGARLRENGEKAEDIAKKLETLRRKVNTSFILEDTEFLLKGGRCTKGEKLAADIFSLKPTINIDGGSLSVGKKFRGRDLTAQKKYIEEKLSSSEPKKKNCLLNYTAFSKEEVEELVSFTKEKGGFENVIVNEAGCCISSHCGKNCMGIIFEDEK
ncbi:MAG: DegV family protein [Clostridia bacterium]|nr:DegV family protein [Clostridia bacterium]